jgi:hypothetical protein
MSLYLGTNKIKGVSVMFVEGDGSSIQPENIKTGVNILGTVGTYTGTGTQTTGYTLATSNDIVEGKAAWVNGSEVLGTVVINSYYYGSSDPSNSLGVDGDIYLKS